MYSILMAAFLAGEALLIFGIHILKIAKDSVRWPQTSGVVTRSLLAYDGDTYRADVRYQFCANGTTQTGSRVTFFDYGTLFPSNALSVLNTLPKGTAVTIRYRPEEPGLCVLDPRIPKVPCLALSAGAVLMLAAFIGIVRENRR